MPDLLTDLTRVRELMARAEAGERVAARAQADAYNFLRTHASGIEAMARDARVVNIEVMREVFNAMPASVAKTAYAAVQTYIDCCNAMAGKPSPFDAMKEAANAT